MSIADNTAQTPRLIATLGPKSFDQARFLATAGATDFRLNASHMLPEELRGRCETLCSDFPRQRCIVDLQGKKMRVGDVSVRELALGTIHSFCCNPQDGEAVFVPHPELFDQVEPGEHLTLDDGRIEVEIVDRHPGRLTTRVTRAGTLRPRKGVNRVAHPLEPIDLSLVDRTVIELCHRYERVDFAVSFASTGLEAAWVRSRAPNARVILKIERQEAISNFDTLAQHADELWICRGDLGAQLGFSTMAREVAKLAPRKYSIPIIMAGQVLEHLTLHDTPTRSEVCHLTDLMIRGYAGIVLSDETAIGLAPVNAAEWAAKLMCEAVHLP